MTTISQFIQQKKSFRHHAILFISNAFRFQPLPAQDFNLLAKELCGVILSESKDESFFDTAVKHPDVFIANRERSLLRLEDIKPIANLSLYYPQKAKRRLFVIENCERLNVNAANSLLKILEEPSIPCLFLLTTSKLSSVLPTILSRVQKIPVAFPNLVLPTPFESLSEEDKLWIKNKVNQFSNKPRELKKTLGSINHSKEILGISAQECAEILLRSEKLAKEIALDELKGFFVVCIQNRLKKEPEFIHTSRFLLSYLSQWNSWENYHPSSFLWISQFFLGFIQR